MNSGLSPADPTLVGAFRSALLHQGAIALLIIAFLWLVWVTARTWRLTAPGQKPSTTDAAAGVDTDGAAGQGRRITSGGPAEPAWRRLLRIGFGIIWIFDGILQAQPKMAAGLPSLAIEPTAASSPAWVQHVVNWGGTIWSYHPITAGAAAVWIQVGIGGWLIVAARGPWSRLAGLASVAWGAVVWVFGESFGGIFAPGLSWLTGAPGAVLIYMTAGALIALPDGAWRSPRLGRLLLGGTGAFFLGMALLQAWPGRGFWKGTINGQPGTLAGMVQSMVTTSQPHFLSAWLNAFGAFTASNGFAVNLVVVIALAAMGAVFLTANPRLVRYAVWFGIAFCLATWVLVQDLGFLGGVGTDPNSMIPMILLFAAGYLAVKPVPQEGAGPEGVLVTDGTSEGGAGSGGAGSGGASPDGASPGGGSPGGASPGGGGPDGGGSGGGWGQRLRGLRPRTLGGRVATASASSVAALTALAITVLGVAPMASATVNHTADPILALAIEGASEQMNTPAYDFQLTDQNGQTVTLASLRGKVVVMTFLDPVCTTDCPIIGQEFKQAGVLLGRQDSDVELVAIVANPTYRSVEFTRAFDREDGLSTVPNWLYLTGSVSQLGRLWDEYGVAVQNLPAGGMTAHEDLAVIIDRSGHIREELGADPGPATTSTESSFSVLLTQYARQVLANS